MGGCLRAGGFCRRNKGVKLRGLHAGHGMVCSCTQDCLSDRDRGTAQDERRSAPSPVRVKRERRERDGTEMSRQFLANFRPSYIGDRKSLPIAKNHPKTSQEFSEQFRPSTQKRRALFSKNQTKRFTRSSPGIPFLASLSGKKRNPNLNFLVQIFSGGAGVFHVKGWGPKSSVCPSKPGKPNLFGGISRDFAGISRRCPKSLR